MSPVLRIVILAIIGIVLFFVGLSAGLMSDSELRPPLQQSVPAIDRGPAPVGPRIVRIPYPVGVPVRVPAPYAIADEQLGAYRVDGYVVFHGPARFSTHRSIMACFPVGR